MAFVSAVQGSTVFGDKRVVFGTFTNGASDTGGDINTGLSSCQVMILQSTGSAINANTPVVNETFPCAGNQVTIVTDADADGTWIAIGK